MKKIQITKASGEEQYFNVQKLINSLSNAGASTEIIEQIVKKTIKSLYPGISTNTIYNKAFELLKELSLPLAGRYKLKKAILELGPTGFPIEHYISKILECNSFQVKVGVIVQGLCVQHEVDVEAEKEHLHYMIECKFHSKSGIKSSVKVPLYVHSRFNDVKSQWEKLYGHSKKYHQGWIITNTRFSKDAIKYGICAGLKMTCWDYPEGASLQKMIENTGLHPITCISDLSNTEKNKLLKQGIVLCKELCEDQSLLSEIGIPSDRIISIIEEGQQICKTPFS